MTPAGLEQLDIAFSDFAKAMDSQMAHMQTHFVPVLRDIDSRLKAIPRLVPEKKKRSPR
jgi:hypothetical protein